MPCGESCRGSARDMNVFWPRTRFGSCGLWTAFAFALALIAPGIASAHDGALMQERAAPPAVLPPSSVDHARHDNVVLKHPTIERRLSNETVARNRPYAQAAAAAVAGNEGDIGQWGPIVDWPVVAIHDALLP